jgi:hypothetical protein
MITLSEPSGPGSGPGGPISAPPITLSADSPNFKNKLEACTSFNLLCPLMDSEVPFCCSDDTSNCGIDGW